MEESMCPEGLGDHRAPVVDRITTSKLNVLEELVKEFMRVNGEHMPRFKAKGEGPHPMSADPSKGKGNSGTNMVEAKMPEEAT